MRRTKWHSNIKKQGTKMNITDYENELILIFAILFNSPIQRKYSPEQKRNSPV